MGLHQTRRGSIRPHAGRSTPSRRVAPSPRPCLDATRREPVRPPAVHTRQHPTTRPRQHGRRRDIPPGRGAQPAWHRTRPNARRRSGRPGRNRTRRQIPRRARRREPSTPTPWWRCGRPRHPRRSGRPNGWANSTVPAGSHSDEATWTQPTTAGRATDQIGPGVRRCAGYEGTTFRSR